MDFKLDRYNWGARVLPVYLTAAPAILAIAATLPEGLDLPLGATSAIVLLPLSYFLSQVTSGLREAAGANTVGFVGRATYNATLAARQP